VEPRPTSPPTAWTPSGTQRGAQAPPPRPERRSEPRRAAPDGPTGRRARPAPPRPTGPTGGGAAAFNSGPASTGFAEPAAPAPESSAGEVTRISEALSGKPAEPPTPQRGRRGQRPPQSEPAGDPEATAQQAPVPAPAKKAKKKAAAAGTATKDGRKPSKADREQAAEADQKGDSDEVKAIDATLARFSAVHDQIAEEEAARRKKFAWLLGKRKEPELGRDMPFDFVEGRDSQASRLEWKKDKRKRRMGLLLKALAVAAALMIFVAIGTMWGAKSWVDGKFHEVSALDPHSSSIKNASAQSGDRNFLMIGSDTRAGAQAADGVGDDRDEPGARSDTTMIAHIPADRSRVTVVSFPRDLEVDLPPCERWDSITGNYTGQMAPEQKRVKLNTAYSVGGPKCTTKVIQQISGLSITNFLGVDFQGFRSMVDSMHGVDICTKTPIIDKTLGTVLPRAGRQTLTGTQALNYVRSRHVEGDPTSDYGRMERQQLFLSALLRKAMSGQVLLDPKKLTGFLDAVAANTFGENVGTDQLADLAQSLQGLDASKVTFVTVPTIGEANAKGNEQLRESDTDELFRAIIDGVPVTPDTRTSKAAEATPTPSGGGAPASGGGAAASGGGAAPARPAPPPGPVTPANAPPPQVPGDLSTVNAGQDLCG
jgi:LCP family protein required for cell wall assembly